MNRHLTIFLLMLIYASAIQSSHAQTNDFGTRVGIEIEKDVKNWNLYVGEEIRTKENSGVLQGLYTEFGADYSPWKIIKIGASYEFIYFNDYENDDYQPRHRTNLFIQGSKEWSRFTFNLKEHFQTTFKDESERDYKMNPKLRWRNKFEIEYNIRKSPINPSFSVETFYQLNNPDGNKFDQLRYKLEVSYKINKRNRLKLYGLVDNEINVKNPVRQTVLGIQYKYTFKN